MNEEPVVGRIAVLDDDIRFIRMVERVLKEDAIAIQPITTLDLHEAVEIIAGGDAFMALVDVYMYGQAAGFEIIELLRQRDETARLPLVVTSGAHRDVGKRVAFLQQYDCDVLLKPFTNDDLLATVRRHQSPPIREVVPAELSKADAQPARAMTPFPVS